MRYPIYILTLIALLVFSFPLIAQNISQKDSSRNSKNLTAIQKFVTGRNGTEPPFHNEYWDNKKEGIYVDLISGKPLFSSIDKYDSGTG